MSLVIALANSSFATMICDGRQRDKMTGIIINENYQKIQKIGKDIYIGYTGTTEVCEKIIEKYLEISQLCNIKNADVSCELLQFIAKTFYSDTNSSANSQFAIIGKDSKNHITLWSMSYKTGFKIEKKQSNNKGFSYAILNPDGITQEHISNILLRIKQANPTDISDTQNALTECLKYAATKDDSINTNITFASIFQ